MSPIQTMQIQPLELSDFSGGLTDNSFDGGATRYAAADNFLISVDRNLQMRPGTVPFDYLNYLLPGQPRRVDALFTYINESKILVNQGRDIFVLPDVYTGNKVWQRVLGPSGNEAIGLGKAYAQTTMSEFQHQMYFTNDSQPIPSRLYQDQNNVYQVRTAGLPRSFNQPLFTSVSLLATCIQNANTILVAMQNHMLDNAGAGSNVWSSLTNQHYALNATAYAFISSVPLATDLPSLLVLVTALNNAYMEHAINSSPLSHYALVLPLPGNTQVSGGLALQAGPFAPLSQPIPPTTLTQAVTMLDDIFKKFYWHMYAVNLHGGPPNDIPTMARYDYTIGSTPITKIGDPGLSTVTNTFIRQPPTVTANNQDFLDYVNGLQGLWNSHCLGGGNSGVAGVIAIPGQNIWGAIGVTNQNLHMQPDQLNYCTLPLSTTTDQAFLKIFWLRVQYHNQHLVDANKLFAFKIKFNSTTGSPNITGVVNSASVAATLPLNSYIFVPNFTTFGPYFSAAPGFQYVARVVSSASGTATLDRNVILGGTGTSAACNTPGASKNTTFHMFYSAPEIPGDSLVQYAPSAAQFLTTPFTSIGTDLVSWNAYAQEFMYCLFNHLQDANVHFDASSVAAQVQNVGLHPIFGPVSPGVQNFYVPTIASIAYAFTYYDTWTVEPNGLQYNNESNPVFTGSIQAVEPLYVGYVPPVPTGVAAFSTATFSVVFNKIAVQRPIQITNIPVVTNDNSTNYSTSTIQARIYRTTNGGNTFFLDGTVNNGVTTYSDIQNSLVAPVGVPLLTSNQTLYTSGGVVGNDQPPQCKCLHIFNGVPYYGGIIQAGQYLPNTVLQGTSQNPDSAPGTFLDNLEDAVVTISSTRNNVIVFCSNSVYRMSGGFNSLGQGALIHERIADTVGCMGPHSVVKTEIGLFFSGNDGFYYTDGFQLIKISIDLNDSYARATQTAAQKARIYGAYDKLTRRIWWSMQTNPSDTDCDMNFIFYLDYGIKPSGVYTAAQNSGSLVPSASTASSSPSVGNPLNYNYWQPSAVVFYQGNLVRGDSRGLLFRSDPFCTTDPKIDLTIAAYTFSGLVPTQQWNTIPIPFNYTTTSMDFGTHVKRKYATRINWLGRNLGNAQVQIVAISDNRRVVGNMAPINYTQNPLWGDSRVTWGATSSPNYNWYYAGSADFWRRFPATTLRANLRQIQFTNAFMGIYRSEDFPPGTSITTNGATKVVTLNAPTFPAGFYGTINWPLDVVDYFLATSLDGYVQTWQIFAVSGNTITVLDTGGTLGTQTGVQFVIRGYKKNQTVSITNIVTRFSVFGDKTNAWQSSADSGENN